MAQILLLTLIRRVPDWKREPILSGSGQAGKYYVRIYRGGTGYYDLVVKPDTILAKRVVLNRKTASIYKGSTLRLSATVTSAGKIIEKRAGTCKIYVKGNGITRTVFVTVKNK